MIRTLADTIREDEDLDAAAFSPELRDKLSNVANRVDSRTRRVQHQDRTCAGSGHFKTSK